MTEQQIDQEIRDGFERLDTALAPPMDAAARVERRVAVRRRRRRTTIAGAAVLGLVAVGGTTVALASGNDGSGETIATEQPSGPVSTLVMTRADGSTVAFPDVDVTCEAPEGEDAETSGPQRIWALSPRHIQGDRVADPFVYFNGIVSEIQGDRTFTFPNDWTMDSAHYPMVLFVADSEGNAERGNEAASSAGGESGTVRVLEASCDPVPTLRLDVDMTLGSEVGQDPIDVAGTLR